MLERRELAGSVRHAGQLHQPEEQLLKHRKPADCAKYRDQLIQSQEQLLERQ